MASYNKGSDAIQHSTASSSETSSQLDDTYEAYKNNQGANVDPVEVKKTLRKIDLRIVPILFFTYLLQYLDKNGINYASAFGLQEGTNLKGQDYSWLGMY
jgi:sugar phosphate permease